MPASVRACVSGMETCLLMWPPFWSVIKVQQQLNTHTKSLENIKKAAHDKNKHDTIGGQAMTQSGQSTIKKKWNSSV